MTPKRRRKRKPKKPGKPYPEFPLFAHNNGLWAKKIRGALYYFGPWRDADAALAKYLEQKDDLHAGRVPRSRQDQDSVTIADLVNHFLTAKQEKLEAGRLSPHTFRDYYKTCGHLVDALGRNTLVGQLGSEDFRQLQTKFKEWGLVAQGNLVA